MQKSSNLGIAALLILTIAIGAVQGSRIDKMREAERFYRWIITYANQARLDRDQKKDVEESDGPKPMDRELLAKVEEVTEPLLPSPTQPLEKGDIDANGKPLSKLLLMVKENINDPQKDALLYKLASGPELADQRNDFLQYSREKRIAAFGNSLSTINILDPSNGDVNIGMIFFGFRTMAANLVWLQVDKYWHQGMMFRMYPLMKTCVTLDPNFIDAFLLGAWHLAYNMTAGLPDTPEKLKEYDPVHKMRVGEKEQLYNYAIDFLKDGISKNPKNYKLYFDLGFATYETKLNDHANAVQYLSEAIRHRHDQWVPRMLYRSMQMNGQFEDALAGWEDYKAKFPESSKPVVARSIATNKALMHERDADISYALADQEKALADQAREEATKAKAAADAARAAGNDAEAQKQDAAAAAATQKAAAADAKVAAARAQGDALYAEARKTWDQLVAEEGGEPFSFGRIARMDARKMIANGQYREAIGLLDYARFQSNAFWNEASDMIIEAKQKGGIPLNISERMELARREDAKQFTLSAPKQIGVRIYEFRKDGIWYQDDYKGQVTKVFAPTPEELAKLKREHPDLVKILDLGGVVTFQLGNDWYQYSPPKNQTATPPAPAAEAHARLVSPVRFTTPHAA